MGFRIKGKALLVGRGIEMDGKADLAAAWERKGVSLLYW
jgi:hypothetical protein